MKFETGGFVPSQNLPYLPVDGVGSFTTGNVLDVNYAVLNPLWVPAPFTVSNVWFVVNNVAGNMDVGIYDKNGNRLASTGSFAVPAVGNRSRALSVTLNPSNNPHYLALGCSTAAALFIVRAVNVYKGFGFATSFPLPATLNLSSPTARTSAQFFSIVLENAAGPAF